MSHNRHVSVLPGTEHLYKKCDHCGKPLEHWVKHRYGSNACKQAAYRKRMLTILSDADNYVTRSPIEARNKGRRRDRASKRKGGVA